MNSNIPAKSTTPLSPSESTIIKPLANILVMPIKGDKLKVPGVGTCRVRLSRPIEGKCNQILIKRRADGWYAFIVCEIPKPKPLPQTGQTVGVDVGIASFATLSSGEEIENPRHLRNALDNLKRQQRRLSRKKKGSKRRARQKIKVARAHQKVSRPPQGFSPQGIDRSC